MCYYLIIIAIIIIICFILYDIIIICIHLSNWLMHMKLQFINRNFAFESYET